MKLIKTVKKILALSTGAVMVGATVMGASAANLNEFPSPWIQNGRFNGLIVVGDQANAGDVLGAIDIATQLQFDARVPVRTGQTTTTTSQVSVSGEAWRVADLEISERGTKVNESISDVDTEIGNSELPTLLADGTLETSDEDYDYKQVLQFEELRNASESGLVSRSVVLAESRNSVNRRDVDLFFYVKKDEQIARYVLEFDSSAEAEITDPAGDVDKTGNTLYNLEGESLTMLGKTWDIVQAETDGTGSVGLTLLGGARTDTLSQGGSEVYTVRGKTYDVTVELVNEDRAKFQINGEITRSIRVGNTDTLKDGSLVGVREINYENFAGGSRLVEFYIGANKIELEDDDIRDTLNGERLIIGTDRADSTEVRITGKVESDRVKIDTIELDFIADSNLFIPEGHMMSEQLEEPEALLGAWDIQYSGLETANTEEIILSGDEEQYTLDFTDGDGESINVPLVHAEAGVNVKLGDSDNLLVLHEFRKIELDDYFVVSDYSQSEGERETYVLQYTGARNGRLDFDVVGGDSQEVTYSTDGDADVDEHLDGSIGIGSQDYRVYAGQNNVMDDTDDFAIKVDLDGSGGLDTAINDDTAKVITTNAGAEITITGVTADAYVDTGVEATIGDDVTLTVSIDNGNNEEFDNKNPSPVGLAISAVSDKLQGKKSANTDHTFEDDGSDTDLAYTSLGARVVYDTSDDVPTLRIDYPVTQQLPQLFVVTPDVQISSTGGGAEAGGPGVFYETNPISPGIGQLASEAGDIRSKNTIVVGGPCANAAAATLMDNPQPCGKDFSQGKALIRLVEHTNGNVALLVAGYDAIDTRRAARVVAEYEKWSQFSGMDLTITGTSFTNIQVAAMEEN